MEKLDEKFEPYFVRLGWFAHSWALMERGMDITAVEIYHQFSAKRKIDEENFPRTAFDRKVQYLRDALRDFKLPSKVAAKLSELLDRAEKLADDRHHMIHGSPLDFIAPDLVKIHRINILSPKRIRIIEREISMAEMTAMADEATALSTIALDIALEMVGEPGNDLSD